ncbi:MAG: beta-ketoacyl reductase, partial [Sedimenticolaceae bacterium]
IRSDRSYLLTGGFGALGQLVLDWLVESGARHLSLLGRRPPSEQTQVLLDQYSADGVQIRCVACDVSQYDALAEVFCAFGNELPALAGVVHTAGVLDDGAVLKLDAQRLSNVMPAKALGAWNLHRLTRDSSLDFSVYFSSATTLLGSRGQGNYSAANAFLDGLARYRRARGLPGLSISWGPWGELGMAAQLNDVGKRRMYDIGWAPLSNKAGIGMLAQLINSDMPQAGVLPLTWSLFLAQFGDRPAPAYFSDVMPRHEQAAESATDATPSAKIREQLLAAPADQRMQLLQKFLGNAIAQVVGIAVSQAPAADAALRDVGMDSLMHMELRNKINAALKINMPIAELIGSETIVDMAKQLITHLAASSVVPDQEIGGEDSAEFEDFTL